MLTSFPDLETQGGNLVVEAILRGILFAAEERQCSNFNTIYVQLDNCDCGMRFTREAWHM